MNTLLNIKAFLLVARTGSFSGAARELGVAPSVVTKRITRLEDEMGAQLFVRSTRALWYRRFATANGIFSSAIQQSRNCGLRFSANAAMPSLRSSVAKVEYAMRRSNRMPSARLDS